MSRFLFLPPDETADFGHPGGEEVPDCVMIYALEQRRRTLGGAHALERNKCNR